MQKIFILLCCALALVCHTSCERYTDIENDLGTQDAIKPDSKVVELIQRARQGEAEAYDALAACYRDGDGVKQSMFNMMSMYMLSCKKSGRNINDVLKPLDPHHPLRLLMNVLDHVRIEDASPEQIAELRSVSPADALIYDAIYALECENDSIASEQLFQEAEAKGSEMACVLHISLYEHLGDMEKCEQALHRYAERFPILHVKLGNLSLEKEHWEQAVVYYSAADRHGMLTARGARGLSNAYARLEAEGKMKCDRQEMARLKVLSNPNSNK